MTQATDTDIRDLKTSIDNLTKATESIARSCEANTKAIGDLSNSFTGLREETRLGFSDMKGEIKTINCRLTNIETNTKVLFDLTEKVGELKNWKQIAIVVFTASVSGSIAWYVRGGSGNL